MALKDLHGNGWRKKWKWLELRTIEFHAELLQKVKAPIQHRMLMGFWHNRASAMTMTLNFK